MIELSYKYYNSQKKKKKKKRFLELKDAMISLKTNQGRELFVVVQIYGFIYTVLSIINSILLLFIKDASKYGAKVTIYIHFFNHYFIILIYYYKYF